MFRNVLIASVVCFLVFISFLMTYAGQSMPVEIKAEFSQYPGSEVINTMAQGERVQVMLHCVGASPDDVYEYYMAEVEQRGWEVLMNLKAGVHQVMFAKDGKEASIVITSEDNETYAVLSITK